jgi:hypothetical protein
MRFAPRIMTDPLPLLLCIRNRPQLIRALFTGSDKDPSSSSPPLPPSTALFLPRINPCVHIISTIKYAIKKQLIRALFTGSDKELKELFQHNQGVFCIRMAVE